MAHSNTSFFFYDLETSGVNARSARIMQFAGQRTDLDLNPIGEPYNILIKLTDDVLPEPGAILVTGITPQMTLADGITEAEFFKIFIEEIASEGTIFVGFNSIRFDDEFMRFGLYRNFYDPYQWQWRDGRSKWDILDLVRITRALRPEGINWPFASDGKPSNKLELLTSVNKLNHTNAHDALSDVNATIAVAKLIKTKQSKLFDYQLSMRDKKTVEQFVAKNHMFVYVSGRYSLENEKLTVVCALGKDPKNQGSLVYDLRTDPDQFLAMNETELHEAWTAKKDEETVQFPVKSMAYNKCPAIAPIGTLKGQEERLSIDYDQISSNYNKLRSSKDFYQKVYNVAEKISASYQQSQLPLDQINVDSALYDGFFENSDHSLAVRIINSAPAELSSFVSKFKDNRLNMLLPLYKARNYPKSLNSDEMSAWENYRQTKISNELPNFLKQFNNVATSMNLSDAQSYVLEELKLYVESIVPSEY